MELEEIKRMVRRMGIPFDETHPDHINAGRLKELAPPFLSYTVEDVNLIADGIVYVSNKAITVRIYADDNPCEEEEDVKEVLEKEEIRWKRTGTYNRDLDLWEIIYEMEV